MRTVAGSRAAAGGQSRLRLRHLIWAAGQVVSFETAFLLFIFAAAYKPDPRFAWFPGDMTLVFFAVSVAAAVVPLLRGGLFYLPGLYALWAGVIFVLWIAASLAWSPSEIYAREKLILVAAGNLWCLIATAMIIGSSRVRVWRLLILLLVFGVLMAVDYTISSVPESRRVENFLRIGENYLALGRLVGLAALVAFALWLRAPARSARGPILLTAFAVCGYVLLKGGGRNPAAAVAVPMLMPLLLSFRLPRGRLVISRSILASLGLIAVLILAVIVLAMFSDSSLRTLQRFDMLMNKVDSGEPANPRLELWRHAVAYWVERPLVGHGVGAWPILYLGQDHRHYPHSIILELLVEFGLVGLGLFAALVLVLAWPVSLRRLREDPALMCVLMLCMNTFINAMSTGDLADNRNLFAMLGLLAMRPPKGPIDVGTKSCPPHVRAPDLRRTDFPQAVRHSDRSRVSVRARRPARGR